MLSSTLQAPSSVARRLLAAKGALTALLEALIREPVRLVLLGQRPTEAVRPRVRLALSDGETLLQRTVILQGAESGTPYVHARSYIALDRLEARFRRALLAGRQPMGRFWSRLQRPVCKEMVARGRRPTAAPGLERLLGASPGQPLLFRTYRVLSGARPLMTITETFPDRW